jgi:hypothetical protein
MGFEQLTVSNSVKTLTEAEFKPKDATLRSAHTAMISLEGTAGTNDVRWTVDGTTPSSSVGHLLKAGDQVVVMGLGNLLKFKAIRAGSSDGILTISYL